MEASKVILCLRQGSREVGKVAKVQDEKEENGTAG
jgi:hypothetical protein